jgi:tetratricopeptide (TPR) repeat protein
VGRRRRSKGIGAAKPRRSFSEQRRRNHAIVAALVLGVAALSLYAPVGGFDFVHYDDDRYVFDNHMVRRGLSPDGLAWALTSSHASNWHPLTWFSHMLDVEVHGMRPGGHHLTSALLHAVNAVLLFLWLRWVTARLWPSVLVAALFAVHPLRVESVAWVSERKDVLSGLFFMLTLLAWAWYARRPGGWRYGLVVLTLCLGLLAKPMLVTLPLLLLLLDVWPLRRWSAAGDGAAATEVALPAEAEEPRRPRRRRPFGLEMPPDFAPASPRRLLLEKVPLLGLSGAAVLATLWAQGAGGAISSAEAIAPAWRVANALVAWAAYLWKSVWPVDLRFFYPHPATLPDAAIGPFALKAAGAAVVLVAISFWAWRAGRRRPYVAVGWLWYVGMLVPVIGLVQVGSQALADRYAYLPLIGVYVVVVWGLTGWLDGRSHPGTWLGIAGAVAIAVLASVTWKQIPTWRDSRSLFESAARIDPDNYIALNGLGNVFRRAGDAERAEVQFARALRAYPDFAPALNSLGLIYKSRGDLDRAREYYERALEARPDFGPAHNNLGNVLRRQGDPEAALTHLRRAVAIEPLNEKAHSNLGNVLVVLRDLDGAVARYRRAIELDPDYTDAHHNLAAVLENQGSVREARHHFERALELDRDYLDARAGLGRVCEADGLQRSAAGHYRELLRADPERLDTALRLAWILATSEDGTLRNGDEALGWAERVARADGHRSPAVLETLAAAFAESGRFDDAVRWQERALAGTAGPERPPAAARLDLYRAGVAYRGPRPGPAGN